MRRRLVLVLAATILATGCARIGYTLQRNFTAQGRIDKKSTAAWRSLEADRYAEAAERYSALRARQPANPYFALGHARALAALDREEEAWPALDAAVAAGLRYAWDVEKDEHLAPLRGDPRFEKIVARTRDNFRAWNARIAEAKRQAPLDAAPAFDSWAKVSESVREENERIRRVEYRRDPTGENEIEAHRLRQVNFAKIRRYLSDHPDATDREQAMLGEVVDRVAIAEPWQIAWPMDEAAAIVEAADRFLVAYPNSASRSTAELHKAVALMRGVLPVTGWDPERTDPYPPDCAHSMPMFEALAMQAPVDIRGIEGEGFLSVCLWEADPRDVERALATAESFLAHEEASEEHGTYFMLPADVRKVRLRAGSLPPFEVKDLAGVTWTPASLAGRVTILQFWSPG